MYCFRLCLTVDDDNDYFAYINEMCILCLHCVPWQWLNNNTSPSSKTDRKYRTQ